MLWVGAQMGKKLMKAGEFIRRVQQLIMYLCQYPDADSRMPATDDKVRYMRVKNFEPTVKELLEEQPEDFMNAVRNRLVAAGSKLTDPVKFLRLVHRNWQAVVTARNTYVHGLTFREAMKAHQCLVALQIKVGKEWGIMSEFTFPVRA